MNLIYQKLTYHQKYFFSSSTSDEDRIMVFMRVDNLQNEIKAYEISW